MKKIISKTAFSLLELIIASVLVLIVIMGIFAINSMLSNNNQDYGQRYFVKSETQTTLNHILNNASLAIGSGTTDTYGNFDQGIWPGAGGPAKWGSFQTAETLCIHQDIDPSKPADYTTVNSPPSTPPDYANSRWLCYTWYPPGDVANSDYQIKYCAMPFTSSAALRGAWNCNFASNLSFPPTFLGTASNGGFQYQFTPTTGWLTVTITNCLDNSQVSGACGTTNNPQQTVSGSIFPAQEGMQQN